MQGLTVSSPVTTTVDVDDFDHGFPVRGRRCTRQVVPPRRMASIGVSVEALRVGESGQDRDCDRRPGWPRW